MIAVLSEGLVAQGKAETDAVCNASAGGDGAARVQSREEPIDGMWGRGGGSRKGNAGCEHAPTRGQYGHAFAVAGGAFGLGDEVR